MNRRFAFVFLIMLAACAQPEEPFILEEPIVDIARETAPVCDPNDEDGIGGTGCEPVARQASDPLLTE